MAKQMRKPTPGGRSAPGVVGAGMRRRKAAAKATGTRQVAKRSTMRTTAAKRAAAKRKGSY